MKRITRSIINFLVELHGLAEMFGQSVFFLFRRPFYFRDIMEQMHTIGVGSLGIVLLITGFTGMVLALQSGYEMAIYGAKMYVGTLIASALVRELGPVLVALVVAGRVGAGITAELGSMQVTEQIDAMRALGTNPVKKLASTRFLALFVMLPVLTVIGDITGILGALVIATSNLGISAPFYWSTVVNVIGFDDFWLGLVKPVVFAMAIAGVSCYKGFKASGGTKGVGDATTQSVVLSSVLIFTLDLIITKLFLSIIL